MSKKTVKADMALKHKGKKAPRPEKGMKLDPSAAPAHKPSMQHMGPSGPWKMPKEKEQSMAPEHKKKAQPQKHAPKMVKGANEGESMPMPGKSDRH